MLSTHAGCGISLWQPKLSKTKARVFLQTDQLLSIKSLEKKWTLIQFKKYPFLLELGRGGARTTL